MNQPGRGEPLSPVDDMSQYKCFFIDCYFLGRRVTSCLQKTVGEVARLPMIFRVFSDKEKR